MQMRQKRGAALISVARFASLQRIFFADSATPTFGEQFEHRLLTGADRAADGRVNDLSIRSAGPKILRHQGRLSQLRAHAPS